MRYRSTRDSSATPRLLSFEECLFQGLAPDGGLYIPESIPNIPELLAVTTTTLKFPQLALRIFRPFISTAEISDSDLLAILTRSFATFSHADVTPLHQLSPDTFILELFHGPTFAFKDVALQVVGNLFEFFLEKRNRGIDGESSRHFITVVGATSGDTGGAAIYGLRGKKDCSVFILHPRNRISPVQEAQMTSVLDDNVHNIAVDGASFDDCQEIVKTLFNDAAFKSKHCLAAINSINWARILSQIIYYFKAYFDIVKRTGGNANNVKVQFSVPTGNFGDVLAGYYASRMGLPIDRLIVATNANDILDRFFKTGRYEKLKMNGKPVNDCLQTLSPAMDILVSSNFERLCWYLLRDSDKSSPSPELRASQLLGEYMTSLKRSGGFTLPPAAHDLTGPLFASASISDADVSIEIRDVFKKNRYVADPHTAVGLVAARRCATFSKNNSKTVSVCLATASPGKFPQAVLEAINGKRSSSSKNAIIQFKDFAPKPLLDVQGLPRRCLIVPMRQNFIEEGVQGVRRAIESRASATVLKKYSKL